jgi:hypothetical protein
MSYYNDNFDPTLDNDLDAKHSDYNGGHSNGGNLGDLCQFNTSYIDLLGKKRKYTLEYYKSGGVGALIKNAITGVKYKNMYVGSLSENKFFKYTLFPTSNKSVCHLLFYETPEQFETHQHLKLSDATIHSWYNKQKLNK